MFITNDAHFNSLQTVIKEKSKFCREIKILVGYFYFLGPTELLAAITENSDLKIKILVGLEADVLNEQIIEIAHSANTSNAILKSRYLESLRKILNHESFDNEEFYKNIQTYLHLIQNGRIEIRKTKKPNHAKLYIFQMNDTASYLIKGFFITGSSNLTRAGLSDQDEFNVSIKDYGFDEANQYFDQLWNSAISFNPKEQEEIIRIIKNETFLKEITPFEAYVYVLKTYLDSFKKKELSESVKEKMEAAGYKPFQYQLDAIGQALAILEEHNGVIIADVVGLGKSVIASAVAYELKKRGLVIAPPGLVGSDDKTTGWKKYLEDFGLAAMGWEAHSVGKLQQLYDLVNKIKDFEVIIVDEAHRFRNQDTLSYDLLKEICRNKKVILLTATPFNNQPSDIFSLIKLFITPKQSTITLNSDIEAQFDHYGYQYKQLLFIKKNHQSKDKKKRQKALEIFKIFYPRNTEIDIKLVDIQLKLLSREMKSVLTPIMIRRNRLDLQKHPLYKKDIQKLSEVQNPIRGFYFLTREQSVFYDKVINDYFKEEGTFTGAIYMPFHYSKNKTTDFEELFQTNLYNLMRRLLVKRFESSFGAFYETIQNFIQIHQKVLAFIEKTNHYILDREWIDKISEYDEEEFMEEFNQKMLEIEKLEESKKSRILYKIEKLDQSFFDDINQDIKLLENIKEQIEKLNLHTSDPKADIIIQHLQKQMKEEPHRKIIIFSEYQATVKHLSDYIQQHNSALFKKCLIVTGNISKTTYNTILENFDASLPSSKQKNNYDILICTDKLSEGFNLNRAGYIINYDIPWNPVRVIQRLGRINRIGKKVFDKLYIMNLFPTEQGENIIKQQAIAESKMFMIHNSIGEDAKIFSPDEEPTPSELYTRLNTNPENLDEESSYTKAYLEFSEYKKNYPEIISAIEKLPPRIKLAKLSEKNELVTLIKKKHLYFIYCDYDANTTNVADFETIWNKIKCSPETKNISLSDVFWKMYSSSLQFSPDYNTPLPKTENSIFNKAFNKLQSLLQDNAYQEHKEFLELLLTDLIHYGTLSDHRLRKIIEIKTPENLLKLKEDLGEKYIQSFMQQHAHHKHIIIAIENQTPNLLNETK